MVFFFLAFGFTFLVLALSVDGCTKEVSDYGRNKRAEEWLIFMFIYVSISAPIFALLQAAIAKRRRLQKRKSARHSSYWALAVVSTLAILLVGLHSALDCGEGTGLSPLPRSVEGPLFYLWLVSGAVLTIVLAGELIRGCFRDAP